MSNFIQWLCILFTFTLPILSSAQEWVATYNGPGDTTDIAFDIALDDNCNIYITGYSLDLSTCEDYATVKYDSDGVEQWVTRYNGPGNDQDEAFAIAVDSVGDVYITGYSYGSGTSGEDYATIKYNTYGVMQWIARYNGPGDGDDRAHAIVVDGAGNVYVTGAITGAGSGTDFATVKYGASGTQLWVARYNHSFNSSDGATALAVDDSGNVYVTGASVTSSAGQDYATIKYDESGVEQWVAFYDCSGYGDMASDIALDSNGNVYVTGTSLTSGTGCDYATVKYNPSGVEQWVMRYNGTGSDFDFAESIVADNVGNVYVTGQSYGSGTINNYDYATVKYDSTGVEQWVARYDGPISDYDAARAIAVDNAGDVYVAGESNGSGTNYDYATVKYDSSGVEQWVVRYNGTADDWDAANAIAIDGANDIYVTGGSIGANTSSDYVTIKYSSTGIKENIITVKKGSKLITTIFTGRLQLPEDKQYKVFDITGRVVEPDKIQPGIYFIEVDGVVTQKVVKIR